MSIKYEINEDLNLILYVCTGVVTGEDFFLFADTVVQDERLKPNMVSIIDILGAVDEITLDDLKRTIVWLKTASDRKGMQPGPVAILSKSRGVHLLLEAFLSFAVGVSVPIAAFDVMEDAILWLGLVERRKDVLQFWEVVNHS